MITFAETQTETRDFVRYCVRCRNLVPLERLVTSESTCSPECEASDTAAYRAYQAAHQAEAQALFDLYASVRARDDSKCRHCGATTDLVIDHIVPVCNGGPTEYSNLQVLCRACNSSKGSGPAVKRKPA
jgi:5-methylcytosine-specific restriction protein A